MAKQKKINQFLILFLICLSFLMTKPAHAGWVQDRISELFAVAISNGLPHFASDKILEFIVAPSYNDSSGRTYKRLFFRFQNAGWLHYSYQPHDPVGAHEASMLLATAMEAKSSGKRVRIILKECSIGRPTGCANEVNGLLLSSDN